MKRLNAEPGDSVSMIVPDVKHTVTGPVTTGLTGTLTLYDATGAVITTASVTNLAGDDWYAALTAPATAGLYRMAMVLTVGSAQRTLEAELRVI